MAMPRAFTIKSLRLAECFGSKVSTGAGAGLVRAAATARQHAGAQGQLPHRPHTAWPDWQLCHRGFAAGTTEPREAPPKLPDRISSAHTLLHAANVLRFRDEVEAMGEQRQSMPWEELLQACHDSEAAGSREEAEQVCTALDGAGVVLRYQGTVYLRPREVAEDVVAALPDTEAEVERRLRHLQDQLAPLEAQKRELDSRAEWRGGALVWGTLAFLCLEWGILVRLTFWELSWDVMEPIAYFLSMTWAIAGYVYFMSTYENFSHERWRSRLVHRWQDNAYRRRGLDLARYEKLSSDVMRYQRYLAQMRAR